MRTRNSTRKHGFCGRLRRHDCRDVGERDFHAQRPGFDFGAGVVAAAQRYRRGQAAHADAHARNQIAQRDGLCGLRRGDSQIRLRIGEMRDRGGVSFLARLAARFHQLAASLLFELRAQFAFLHGFDRARDFLFVLFNASAQIAARVP